MGANQSGYSDKQVREHREKVEGQVHSQLGQREGVLSQLEELMGNFAHRYLVTSEEQTVSPQREGSRVVASALEKNMKEALKYAHPTAREGIVKLLQTVPLKQGPTVKYIMSFECLEWNDEGVGKIRARATISWDHPEHKDIQKSFSIDKIFHSSEALDFRNRFPRFVEQDICRIFSNEAT